MSAFYEMSEMTSSEFRDVAKTVEIALVPVGATEQHGPHLAMATDYGVAHRLAQAIARRLYPKAVVAPPLPFGFSHHHTGFAGTITIEPETFAAVCIDIARSLKRDGVRRLLFVNGHQGNNAILNVVTNKIYYELGIAGCYKFLSPKQPIVLKRTAKLHESVMPAKSRPASSCI
jgi:creatinine amidohydrolase